MRSIHSVSLILTIAVICGCAHSSGLIKSASVNSRNDIFKVISNKEKTSLGNTELTITAAFKKEKPGDYLFGNKSSDAVERTLLVNVDGQVMTIRGKVREERNKNINPQDPEAGVGIRYNFNTKMEIKSGAHHIIIAIPEDSIAIEKDIRLLDRTANYINLEPIYRASAYRRGLWGLTSFHEGLKGFVAILNGAII